MTQSSVILDANGNPFPMSGSVPARPRRARADTSGGGVPYPDGATLPVGMAAGMFPYDASSVATQEMGDWLPVIRSPDSEINWYRDRMVARSRDLARNSGWANGAITRILDNTVGTNLRLRARPDYRALKQRFGINADEVWADEFRQAVEAVWRTFTSHPRKWNDVERSMTVGQQFRVAMRHKLIDGDSLILNYWMPERVVHGGADYSTCFLLVDPDRLCNPMMGPDTKYLRGGVALDQHGAPVGYHIRDAEPYDAYNAIESNHWTYVPREDDDGWLRVIHDFDRDRAGQHRGIGIFTSVLGHMKMLAKYYGVELQQAVVASIFGTYVTSPFDPALVQDALGVDDGYGTDGVSLPMYQDLRAQWHSQRPALLNGVVVPTLAPGESIESVSSQHPHTNFAAFAREMLCVFASATGLSVEQVTQDWSKTNYASARAALMETWKGLMRRRHDFATNTATPAYATWLEEAIENGDVPLPAGCPDYIDCMAELSACTWLGPARGWVDPTKEPEGAIKRLEAGISNLDAEAAEQGEDWEENLHKLAIQRKAYKEAGVPFPQWGADQQVPGAETGAGSHDPNSPNYNSKD